MGTWKFSTAFTRAILSLFPKTIGVPLLIAENLAMTYQHDGAETPALRGVSFTVDAGEFVAIMGPSGSGKSTLLHIIGLLERPTGGTYTFDGKSIDEYSPEEVARVRNAKIGFVFQAFHLLPRLSVMENTMTPLLYSGVPEAQWQERAESALTTVGLSHRLGHTPSQLSGGERQRAAIARALVNNPAVIFADEPTGNLDTASGEAVMQMLRMLNRDRRHTIVMITHDAEKARYAERAIFMRDGRIERMGMPV